MNRIKLPNIVNRLHEIQEIEKHVKYHQQSFRKKNLEDKMNWFSQQINDIERNW